MGASLSSDVYQYKVDGCLEAISQCVAIANDIIIFRYRSDETDHDETVRSVMKKAKEVGMHFNPKQVSIQENSEVKFFQNAPK